MNTTPTDTPETDALRESYAHLGPNWLAFEVFAKASERFERRARAAEARVKELEESINFKEVCSTCNTPTDPADVEAGECIWCIAKQVKRERDQARAALRLRPIAEAGPVPDGCIRVSGYQTQSSACGWLLGIDAVSRDTHFADIRMPFAQPAPADSPEPLDVLEQCRQFVAYAYSQGIEGAEDAGRAIDAALASKKGVAK